MESKLRKDHETRVRLASVDLLRGVKREVSYKEISSILGIKESLLCRYVSGNTIPSQSQSRYIIQKLLSSNLFKKILKNKLKIHSDGFIDTHILLESPLLLKSIIESFLINNQSLTDIDAVVSPAVNGVPFGMIVSLILDKPLVTVKKYREALMFDYYEEPFKETGGVISTLYLRKDLIKQGDRVTIVDDIVRSGNTIDHVVRLVSMSKANIRGVFVLVNNSHRRVTKGGYEIRSILDVEPT